jgi:putative endonuclease
VGEGDWKQESLRVGVRGKPTLYWYLRRQGYVFIAKNYAPAREKVELDLVGFDGDTLAFVEVRTRAAVKGKIALPELRISREKH